jgi:hypothetical protein
MWLSKQMCLMRGGWWLPEVALWWQGVPSMPAGPSGTVSRQGRVALTRRGVPGPLPWELGPGGAETGRCGPRRVA